MGTGKEKALQAIFEFYFLKSYILNVKKNTRASCPFFYVNRIMINLIAVSGIEKYLFKNLNPIFFGTDYEIIRVKVYEKKEKIVQIMIDHQKRIIDINDCAKYSHIISNFLDEKNLISDDYSLELSSPGIDRPLTRFKDFQKFKGNKIKVTTINLENEKKVYKGILADIMEKNILLDQNKHLISIELDKISDAKLLV